MARRRKITVELTEPQFLALFHAVDEARMGWADDYDSDPAMRRLVDTADRAWSKISKAWHRR